MSELKEFTFMMTVDSIKHEGTIEHVKQRLLSQLATRLVDELDKFGEYHLILHWDRHNQGSEHSFEAEISLRCSLHAADRAPRLSRLWVV